MRQLEGKTVAARSAGLYAAMLQRAYPDLRVLPMPSPDAALEAVIAGRADAALGTTLTFEPFMKRRFVSELNVSRPQIELVMLAQIASRSSKPLLGSIIEKALATVTTRDESIIRERWVRDTDYGAPSFRSVVKYNGLQTILLVCGGLLVVWFSYRAHQAKRAALESERVKVRFLATMSHEIRTPISVMTGAVEVLLETPLTSHQRRLASTATHAAEALGALLDNVLDLTKLDERHMGLEKVPTDIALLLSRMVDIFTQRARQRGLTLELRIDGDTSNLLLVDPTRLRQILINLLGNAIKFTHVGGVTINARIILTSAGADLQLSVVDTGIGLPPEAIEQVFHAFTQADESTTRRFGGTGLGLTICRELVELMSGKIWIESEVGQGTAVHLHIPSLQVSSGQIADEAHAKGISRYARVLLVDDHADNRFVIGQQLAQIGVHVELADSAGEALAMLARSQYSVVLMDCHMPEMDGYTAVETLRLRESERGRARAVVIALSAASDASHLERCLSSGMDGVLRKPVRMEDLRSLLELWSVGEEGYMAPSESFDSQEAFFDGDCSERYRPALVEDLLELRAAASAREVGRCSDLAHRLMGAALMGGYAELADWSKGVEDGTMGWEAIVDGTEDFLASLIQSDGAIN